MKKTDKLGLNIFEGTDKMSMAALNENAEKVDSAVASIEADIAEGVPVHASRHATDGEDPITPALIGLGNVQNVSTNNQTPTYTEASTLSKLSSGEKMSVAFGKLSKAVAELISHIASNANPHDVTASQVGAALNYAGKIADTDLLAWAKKQTSSVCGFCDRASTTDNLPVTASGFVFVCCSGAGGWAISYYAPSNKKMYYNITSGGSWVGWSTVATTDYAVNKAGDTMTGNLTIEKSIPITTWKDTSTGAEARVFCANGRVYVQIQNDSADGNNRRHLQIMDSDIQAIGSALALVDIVNGVATNYPIYHTGNKPTAEDVGAATTVTYNATVTTNWTADGSYYKQSITVSGITANDNPVVDVKTGTDNDSNKLYSEAIGKVVRISTAANSITVYATEAISIAFPIQLKVVR